MTPCSSSLPASKSPCMIARASGMRFHDEQSWGVMQSTTVQCSIISKRGRARCKRHASKGVLLLLGLLGALGRYPLWAMFPCSQNT